MKKSISILHEDLSSRGGAQQVCMNVIESIQNIHNVKLITGSRPDISNLNDHYGTSVEDVEIETLNFDLKGKNRIVKSVLKRDYLKYCITNPKIIPIWAFRQVLLILANCIRYGNIPSKLVKTIKKPAILSRIFKTKRYTQTDLIINTGNFKVPISEKNIQYVHYPFGWEYMYRKEVWASNINKKIAKYDPSLFENSKIFANSKWTSRKFESIYGTSPEVLNPPIRTSEFSRQISPIGRKNAFVIAGRVSPEKNVLRSIEIIERVRHEGFSIKLHIVGPFGDYNYVKKVKKRSESKNWIDLHGKVERKRYVKLLETCKYGIHGHDSEHFGIVVAEMVAAGMIPFVPSRGGQVSIVNSNTDLLYQSKKEATNKISSMLRDKQKRSRTFINLKKYSQKFDVDSFRKKVRSSIEEALS